MPSRLTVLIHDDLMNRLREVRAACLRANGRDLPASHIVEASLLWFLPWVEVRRNKKETARRSTIAVHAQRWRLKKSRKRKRKVRA